MNLCTFIGHDYREEGYVVDIPGYPIEHDVDAYCTRCDDHFTETIVTRWQALCFVFRKLWYRYRSVGGV